MSSSDSTFQPSTDAEHWRMAAHWPELVTALTGQSITSVNVLVRGLDVLLQRGRITEDEYKVLARPAERLRQCGVLSQQIVRLQSGQVRQSHEKIDLAYLVESVLQERRNELTLMGIAVRRKFIPVDVLIDPTLGFSLTTAMLEWSQTFGHRLELRLDAAGAPPQARLSLKTFADPSRPVLESAVFEDTIHWLMLCQIAATDGGIEVERRTAEDGVSLVVTFKRTVLARPDIDAQIGDSVLPSLSDAYVLVCSADAQVRQEALEVLRALGIQADSVASTEQALAAMEQHELHLLVLDELSPPADVDGLLNELRTTHPLLPTVVIAAEKAGNTERPVVARTELRQTLGTAVTLTLSKVM